MVYTSIYGGLGNQMFQYAIAKSIAVHQKTKFKMDVHKIGNNPLKNLSLSKFCVELNIAEGVEVEKYHNNKYLDFIFSKLNKKGCYFGGKYFEKKEFTFDKNVFNTKQVYLQGYWQSYKYFESIRDELLIDFTLKNKLNNENKSVLNQIEISNSVSIHLRRGDYFTNKKNRKLYDVIDKNYYQNAVNYMSSNIDAPHFFIFSDDIAWAKNKFDMDNATFVSVNSTSNFECDLVLMSKCKHNIIANSTFSWWAAWLNDFSKKKVVCSKRWISTQKNLDDLYPEKWIKL